MPWHAHSVLDPDCLNEICLVHVVILRYVAPVNKHRARYGNTYTDVHVATRSDVGVWQLLLRSAPQLRMVCDKLVCISA